MMPDPDPTSLDRAVLPVVWEIGDDSPRWQAYRDLDHIGQENLASIGLDPNADPLVLTDLAHLPQTFAALDAAGKRGCADADARATGHVYACPAWCIADHPREGIAEADALGPVHAAGPGWEVPTTGRTPVYVDVEAFPGEPARVRVGDEDLTAAQARALACALVEAARLLDQVQP